MKLASTWILVLSFAFVAQAQLQLLPASNSDCQEIVTFSGQQVRVNGDVCDVLVDAAGNVIVAGEHVFWSSESPPTKTGRYQIHARTMGTSS